MSAPAALYLSDLDGTLLDGRGELSARTQKGLASLLEQGALFSVASARSYFSIKKLFGDLELSLPIIEFNGAFLTDFKTGRHLEVNSLGQALGEELYDQILAAGQRPFVCSFNGQEDCLHYDELINPGMVWYEQRRREASDTRLRRTLALRDTMREEVVSLTVMDRDQGKILALYERFQVRYGEKLQLYCYENEYSKGTYWLTIHSEKASKHIAMKSLRSRVASHAELVTFGDNVNDLAMLKHADRGIAVANAVPELKEVAQVVIESHTEDSVIRFVEQDFLRKKAALV